MTPLQIEIALHYHCRSTVCDYRDGDFSAPAVKEAIEGFVRMGLLEHTPTRAIEVSYVATDRLTAYIEHLCNVPLPVRRWVRPDATEFNPKSE